MRIEVTVAAALAVCGALACAAGARAQVGDTHVVWSTYLRAGPGQTYAALDEIEHGVALRVRGCAAGWCRVAGDGIEGYVDQDALTLTRPPPPAPGASACVLADQADARRPMPTRFCSAAAAPTLR